MRDPIRAGRNSLGDREAAVAGRPSGRRLRERSRRRAARDRRSAPTPHAKSSALVGIDTNYGDSVTLRNITIVGDSSKKIVPCQKYIGNSTGAEATTNGSGPDGTYCTYSPSDISYKQPHPPPR